MQVQAVNLEARVSMLDENNRLFCRLDGLTPAAREQKRMTALKSLGLLEAATIAVFDEATQIAARNLEIPICILGLMESKNFAITSAVGLSQVGLMNQLATSRTIPREESFDRYVVDSQQFLSIENTTTNSVFASSLLVQYYGIRSYLGTPLLTAEGDCIGTLGVMDLIPRQFTKRDLEFLSMTARWCLREFELDYHQTQLSKKRRSPGQSEPEENPLLENSPDSDQDSSESSSFPKDPKEIQLELLAELTAELRTPLTSVIGMASVLKQEIYGPLTYKQKEYLDVIHNSGERLGSLAEEIINLGILDDTIAALHVAPVDIEMLCQQTVNTLISIAQQQKQEIRFSVAPGDRIWLLDKDKVHQSLYYLVISMLESADPGGEVRIHVSRKSKTLNIAVWVSHPWLGDGLPPVKLNLPPLTNYLDLALANTTDDQTESEISDSVVGYQILTSSTLITIWEKIRQEKLQSDRKTDRELLGVLLSCHLVEMHGGKITVQGDSNSSYRYVLKLPKLDS